MPLGIARLNTLSRRTSTAARVANTFTVVNQAAISSSEQQFGSGSLKLDGVDDRIYLNSGVDLRTTGEFTWECRFYALRTTASALLYFGTGTNAFYLQIDGVNNRVGFVEDGVTGRIYYSVGTLTLNAWHHLAVSRDSSNVCRIFYDGTVGGTTYTKSGLVGDDSTFYIGTSNSGTYDFQGFIDEVRISDICRYTTSFTPATSEFTNDANTTLLLHFNDYNGSTSIIDDVGDAIGEGTRPALTPVLAGNVQISTAQYKFGSSSAVFDGGGDNLKYTSDTLYIGPNNFTIEMFIRPNTVNTTQYLYDQRNAGTSQAAPVIYMSSSNVLIYFVSNSSRISSSSGIFSVGTWYHIAVSRSNGSTRMFVDGVQVGSTYTDTSVYLNLPVFMGTAFNATGGYNGYIDEVRVSNTARYTSNFTAPTSAFTADANTLLLLHMEGANASTTFTDTNT